jgi:MerR HTH family regulatory protein
VANTNVPAAAGRPGSPQQPRGQSLIEEASSQPLRSAKVRRALSEPPLLYSRRDAAHLLSCSIETLRRYERVGLLDPVRLNKLSRKGSVYYRRAQLLALAGQGGDDASA